MSRVHAPTAVLAIALLSACAQPTPTQAVNTTAASSILAGSTPAAGSVVATSVNELVLRFSPPARLAQVAVTGPDGTMPMMITPVGETGTYELPLPDLDPGSYTVEWRATAAGNEYQGSFNFTVRPLAHPIHDTARGEL